MTASDFPAVSQQKARVELAPFFVLQGWEKRGRVPHVMVRRFM